MNEIVQYRGASDPKPLTLKIGKSYELTNGEHAIIRSIRTNGSETIVYYKTGYDKKHWYSSRRWALVSCTIVEFKKQLLDLGQIDEVFLSAR